MVTLTSSLQFARSRPFPPSLAPSLPNQNNPNESRPKLQFSNECWCGTSDNEADYERHGEGVCHMGCSGDGTVACGECVPRFLVSRTALGSVAAGDGALDGSHPFVVCSWPFKPRRCVAVDGPAVVHVLVSCIQPNRSPHPLRRVHPLFTGKPVAPKGGYDAYSLFKYDNGGEIPTPAPVTDSPDTSTMAPVMGEAPTTPPVTASPVRTEEPTAAVTSAPTSTRGSMPTTSTCSNGVPGIETSKGACCVAACGQCGGAGCSTVALDLGLGPDECCEGDILDANRPCGEAPCVIGGKLVAKTIKNVCTYMAAGWMAYRIRRLPPRPPPFGLLPSLALVITLSSTPLQDDGWGEIRGNGASVTLAAGFWLPLDLPLTSC